MTATPSSRLIRLLWPALMLIGVVALYFPPPRDDGSRRLLGFDYELLHRRRIGFALEHLSGDGRIPAWYPREQLGTPFWSNIQNFPLVPTRLVVLPLGEDRAYTMAILLNASLAALFTYLFARSLGMHVFGSAVAGWTFAASGFFASRLLAGHLHLLEGFPAPAACRSRFTPSPPPIDDLMTSAFTIRSA